MVTALIDEEGFRANVGIMLSNHKGQLLWAKRVGTQDAWQFPQGGIKSGETAESALYRELEEEIGLSPKDVEIVDVTSGWLKYRLPQHLVRNHQSPICIGQKQKWFLLKLVSNESAITLDHADNVEFTDWRWVSYWYPIDHVVSFKRKVYQKALKSLAPAHSRLQQALTQLRTH